MRDVALVLLAAGGASRMGTAKQLLDVGGEPMVRRAARAALASRCRPVVVVVGASAGPVRAAVDGLDVEVVVHDGWTRGIGSSIRAGVARALDANPRAVVIALADQPLVGAATFDELVGRFDEGDVDAVACRYEGTVGAPALFASGLAVRLLSVADDEGCKSILTGIGREAPSSLAVVPCAQAASDVDTPRDWSAVTRLVASIRDESTAATVRRPA